MHNLVDYEPILWVAPRRKACSSSQVEAARIENGPLLLINDDELEQSGRSGSSLDKTDSDQYSEQSFDPDDMDEGAVNEVKWCEIEEANKNGVSRACFPIADARMGKAPQII